MTATLKRLEKLNESPFLNADGAAANELVRKDRVNFKKLLRSHLLLQFEYSVLCADIVKFINDKEIQGIKESDEKLLRLKLYEAIILAEILEHLYRHYLAISSEAIKLKNHQNKYRALLQSLAKNEEIEADFSLSQYVRSNHLFLNWHRVFSVRTRRMFVVLAPFFEKRFFGKAINFVEKFTGPFFNWLSWVFFIPRLANNGFILLKHLIILDKENKEYDLDWGVRLLEQLKRRWHELANDIVWLVAGLLVCFVLTGSLAAVGMYLTIALFFYDVLVTGLRAYIDLSRLNDLAAEYKTILGSDIENSEFDAILQKRIAQEQKRLLLNVINHAALFIGMIFSIPALVTISPVFPVVGSILILLITFAVFYASRKFGKEELPESIAFDKAKALLPTDALASHSLFALSPAHRAHIYQEDADFRP